MQLASLVEENFDELASLESLDCGKPISLARRIDVPRAVRNFRFFATAILHAETKVPPDGRRSAQLHPAPASGRGRADLPWNLPLYLLTWKIAPAVAAGNCCVASPRARR
jgi:aminomuconate-semialdehyde/2-hydroxymuconate-6-semialdehyde dehydrogenase